MHWRLGLPCTLRGRLHGASFPDRGPGTGCTGIARALVGLSGPPGQLNQTAHDCAGPRATPTDRSRGECGPESILKRECARETPALLVEPGLLGPRVR